MKFSDLQPGMTVLAGHSRPRAKYWRLADMEMAQVLKTGVEARYSVTVGGWADQRTEYRHTGQGVRLRVTRNSVTGRDGPLEPTYEKVTIPAYLLPAEGETLEQWTKVRRIDEENKARRAAIEAEKDELKTWFADKGYTIDFDLKGNVLMTRDEAARLARVLP
jgi:hypothetical protein